MDGYRALLIGNSTFPADPQNLQELKGPVKDVAALGGALTDRETGLFDPDNVGLLLERPVGKILEEIEALLFDARRDDKLLLFYSGHGLLDERNRLFLAANNTRLDRLRSTAVSATDISDMLDSSAARTVIIVLDCCHSGAFKGNISPANLAGSGRFVLTSCRSGELANDADRRNGTSLFTQHLVDGLTGGVPDLDQDGSVDVDEVYRYVHDRLTELNRQIPQRRFDGSAETPALARRPIPSNAGGFTASATPGTGAATSGDAPGGTVGFGPYGETENERVRGADLPRSLKASSARAEVSSVKATRGIGGGEPGTVPWLRRWRRRPALVLTIGASLVTGAMLVLIVPTVKGWLSPGGVDCSGANLVVNGSFEDVLSGWTVKLGAPRSVRYDQPGLQPHPPADYLGSSYAVGDASGAAAMLEQEMSLAPCQAGIAAGGKNLYVGGWMGGYLRHEDTIQVSVLFRAAGKTFEGLCTADGPTAAERGGVTKMIETGAGPCPIPSTATSAIFQVRFTSDGTGGESTASFDNAYVKVG